LIARLALQRRDPGSDADKLGLFERKRERFQKGLVHDLPGRSGQKGARPLIVRRHQVDLPPPLFLLPLTLIGLARSCRTAIVHLDFGNWVNAGSDESSCGDPAFADKGPNKAVNGRIGPRLIASTRFTSKAAVAVRTTFGASHWD
jgi:hypothetical protein